MFHGLAINDLGGREKIENEFIFIEGMPISSIGGRAVRSRKGHTKPCFRDGPSMIWEGADEKSKMNFFFCGNAY